MSDQSRNIDSLFAEAVEIESMAERAKYVDQSCAGDPKLRKQLNDLLAFHSESAGFLSEPPAELDVTQFHISGDTPPGNSASNGPGHPTSERRSILEQIGQTIDVPRVVLDSSLAEGATPVVRPSSKQMPTNEGDDRYQFHGEIARGGMGAILKGRDTDLGRDLAVKVLLDEHREKPAVIQRFVEEAQIGGQLQHPGIVPVYELGQFKDERPFFTMKLVKGKTLSALLSERKSVEVDRARFLGIFEQICQTMAYAHSRSVIHRDLKPSNVMVGAFGEVQVMDWGLAKVLVEGGVADEKRATENRTSMSIIQTIRSLGSETPEGWGSGSTGSQTQMGSVMGTPAYMSPEQALGEIDRLDERCDVFGLGAMLCEILTGDPPYTGEDNTEIFRKASRAKLEECFERLDGCEVDEGLVQLIRDCLEPEPDDRIRDAGVLAERVTEYLESVEKRVRDAELARVEADTRATEERKRRKVFGALAVSTLLTILVAGGGWIWGQQKEARIQQAAEQQRIEAEQEARGEFSTARALANIDADDLPDKPSLSRAMAAMDRAEKSLQKGNADSPLIANAAELRGQLQQLERNINLAAALDEGWQTEMAQTDDANMSLGAADFDVLNAEAKYRQAFADWGLTLGETELDAAAEKIKSLPPSIQSSAVAALDRWLALLKAGPTVVQWQEYDWKSLKPVELKSRGGDTLTVEKEGSILASGAHGYAGYELTFETDEKTIASFRLEALPHELLPGKGPGRGASGTFHIRDQRVTVAPRSNPTDATEVRFRAAKASHGGYLWAVTPQSWHIGTMFAGERKVAVYECEEPLESESGFVIRITTGDHPRRSDGRDIQALGHFRWSVQGAPMRDDQANWLVGLRDKVDLNQWRKDLRADMTGNDLEGIIRRLADERETEDQPEMVLIRLADFLQSIPESEIHSLVLNSTKWEVVSPRNMKIELEPGVELTSDPDQSFVLSGNAPERESISVSIPIRDKPIRAIRLELLTVPDEQDRLPTIGRTKNQIQLAEISTWLQSHDDAEQLDTVAIPLNHIFSDYAGQIEWGNTVDGDEQTFAFLSDPRSPRTITLSLDQAAVESALAQSESSKALRITTETVQSGCLARLRVSATYDECDVPNPTASALALLKRLNQNDPQDYWVQMALARAFQKQVPPRMEEALQHATAAVALRPDAVTSHEAVLRSIRADQLKPGSRIAELAVAHADRIRKLTGHCRALWELKAACSNDADRLRDERKEAASADKTMLSLRLDPDSPDTIRKAGYRLWRLKRYEDATRVIENGIEQHPKSGVLHNELGQLHLAMLDTEKEEASYRGAITAEPTYLTAYYNLSKCLRKKGKSAEAIAVLQDAIQVAPDNPRPYYSLALLHGTLGDFAAKETLLRKTMAVDPSHTSAPLDLAVELRRQLKFDEAINVVRAASKAQPHYAHHHFRLGWHYEYVSTLNGESRWEEAIASYRRAVDLAPRKSEYRSSLARVLANLQREDEAVQVWKDCIPLVPNDTYPVNNLGVTLQRIGRIEEAAEAFRRVLELNPKASYVSFGNLAGVLNTLGRFEEAEQVCRDAIDVNPNKAKAHSILASFLVSRERFDEAETSFRRAIELSPNNRLQIVPLYEMLWSQGRLDEVTELLQRQVTKFPQAESGWRILGRMLYKQNKYPDIVPQFRKALKEQPDNAILKIHIAWSLLEHPGNEQYAEWALELAENAAEATNNHSLALYVLGLAYSRVEKSDEARETLRAADERHESERGQSIADYQTLNIRAIKWCALAMVAHRDGHFDEARDLLRRAEEETAPWSMAKEIDVHKSLTLFFYTACSFLKETRELLDAAAPQTPEQRVELGIKRLEGFVERYPDDAWGVERLSAIYGWFDRKSEHHELCSKALDQLNDDDPSAWFHQRAYGVLTMADADPELTERAIQAARTAMTKPQAGVWEKLTHGLAELRAGDFVKAEQRFSEVWGLGDSYSRPSAPVNRFTEVLLRRSVARHHLGKTSEARADYERAKSRIKLPLPSKNELTQDTELITRIRVWLAYEEAAEVFEKEE